MRRLNVVRSDCSVGSGDGCVPERRHSSLEEFGICSRSGIIYNPFGQKPEWALRKAEKLRQQFCLTNAKEAML
jgi:hypothetical protein